MNRRKLILGSAILLFSPAIVKASSVLPGYLNSYDYRASPDDYTNLQTFLNDLGNNGGTGFLAPGEYNITGGDLTLNVNHSVPTTKLSAHGARIYTDPTQARIGLVIPRTAANNHNDGPRKVIVEGLQIDHFGNPSAVAGIKINGALFTVLRDCVFTGRGNGAGIASNQNYRSVSVEQSNPNDGGTGSYLTRIESCSFAGGVVKLPWSIGFFGQCNRSSVVGCSFLYANNGIVLATDNGGNILNGLNITDNAFEMVDQCIMFASPVANYTTCYGLMADGNKVEFCSTFFYYRLNKNPTAHAPIISNTMLIASNLLYNPNNLTVTYATY